MNSPEATTHDARAARLQSLQPSDLARVHHIEQCVQSHPWSLRHFEDSVAQQHWAQCLWLDHELQGFVIAAPGFEEVHLLNIALMPGHRGQGHAQFMFEALVAWAMAQQAQQLWLEVRVSNTRAQSFYHRCGCASVGLRKAYYPAHGAAREDAIVMRKALNSTPSGTP
jgi:[ribosomal protein S18]-alanine N-acetyltransferase